jgi:hypothetical protein
MPQPMVIRFLMSAETSPYCPIYITAWTALSVFLSIVLFGVFVFGDSLLHAGGIVWSLIRWLASPII